MRLHIINKFVFSLTKVEYVGFEWNKHKKLHQGSAPPPPNEWSFSLV